MTVSFGWAKLQIAEDRIAMLSSWFNDIPISILEGAGDSIILSVSRKKTRLLKEELWVLSALWTLETEFNNMHKDKDDDDRDWLRLL